MTEIEARASDPPRVASSGPSFAEAEVLDQAGHVDIEALDQVEARLRDAGRWEDLVRMLSFASERCPSAERARRAWLTIGEVWRNQLGTARRAEPFLARVLASDPENVEALEGMRSIALAAQRWEEAADLTERLAVLHHGQPEAADHWVQLADLCSTRLAYPERALRALARARAEDSSRRDVLERALALLIQQERWLECVRVLEDHQVLIQHAGPAARVELAHRYAEVGARLSHHALHHRTAEACLGKARELGDREALSRLDELAAQRSDWQARARDLVAEGLETRDKRRAAQLYVQAAEMHLVYGRDPVKADEHLNRALILRGYEPALAYLETVFLGQGKGQELLKRLNAMLAGVRDAPTRVEVSMRIAKLIGQLGPESGASFEMLLSTFERVLALDPGHREAARACTALLEDAGRHAQIASVLEKHLAAISDEYGKVAIHLRLGRMYAEVLGDSARSRAHFEAVLAMRPTHYLAATALRALYRDADEAPMVLGVLRVLLEYMPDLETRRRLLDEMETVADQVSVEDRYAVTRRRFDLFPADDALRQDFARRSHELHRDLTFAQSLERAAARLPRARSVDLWREAARVYDERLPRPEDAVRCLQAALTLEPDDPQMQEDLERLLRQQDDPQSLAALLESQLDRTNDIEKQQVLASKLGEVLFKELSDTEGAARQFERVLARDPENPTALEQLDELYRARGDAAAREAILARREQITRDPDQLFEIQLSRARLLAKELERPDEAVDALLELIEQHPDRAEPRDALLKLLDLGTRERDIARALERHFARRGEYARQVEMLAILVRREMDAVERKGLALRAAHLCDARLGAYGPAFDYLAIALALDPADDAVKDHLLEASGRIQAAERAAQVFATILERDDLEPEIVSSLASSSAELRERELDDPDGAVRDYRRVLVADPASSTAVAALERILTGLGRHAELADLLAQQLDAVPAEEDRGRLLVALADVRENHLRDLDGAIDACRQAALLRPTDGSIQVRLADLLERAGRRRELIKLLGRMAEASTSAEERAAAHARIGDAMRAEGDVESAVQSYERALGVSSEHPKALTGLEASLDDPQAAGAAGRVLAPTYERQGRLDDLARALEAALPTRAAGQERFEALCQLARLHRERRADPESAFEAWTRAFREGPELSGEDFDGWEASAVAARRARDLAGIWSEVAEEGRADPELLRRLARLWEGPAAEPARAKAIWEALLAKSPGDVEALEALERLTASTDPERLVQILSARAEVESDPTKKVALHRRVAALAEERLDDYDRAVEHLEHAAALAPDDASLLGELTRLYELVGAQESRRKALEHLIDLQTAPAAKADAIVALGRCLVEFGELDAAVRTYARAQQVAPDHGPAREGLEALIDSPVALPAAEALEPVYRRTGNWARLVEVYEVRARAIEDPNEAVEQWVAIRSMWEDRLGRVEPAFEAALECVGRAPDQPEHWAALERLAMAAGGIERAVERSEARVRAATDDEQRSARAVEHAERLERLGVEGGRVAAAWARVRELATGRRGALRPLARYFERAGRVKELAETLTALAELVPAGERGELHRKAGTIWMDRLAAPEPATRAFELVLETEPDDDDALRRLDALYDRSKQPERRAAVLERRARNASPADRVALLLDLAKVRTDELREPPAALSALDGALALDPQRALPVVQDFARAVRSSHPHAAMRAAALTLRHLDASEDAAARAEMLETAAAGADDPRSRSAWRRERAELLERSLAQPELAFAALVEAHRDVPQDPEIVAELERLSRQTDNDDELADLFAQTVAASEDVDLRLDLARRAARLYDEVLDRPDAALAMIRVIREHAPSDPEAFAALERLAQKQGDAHQRVELYRALIEETPDRPSQAELWLRIANIAEEELSDSDLAYDGYRGWAEAGGDAAEVRRRFAALCERTGRLDELATLLKEDVAREDDRDEKKQLWLRLGALHRDRRQDPSAAVQAFAGALEVAPGDPGALEALAELLRAAPQAVAARAATLLLRHVDPSAVEQRTAAHVVLAETSPELEDRKDHWLEASRLAEAELQRDDAAFDYAVRAVYEDPADVDVRGRAEQLADRASRWPDLSTVYESVLSSVADADTACAIHTTLARRFEAEGDRARAIAEYQMALEHAPHDSEVLSALERLLEGEGDFAQLSDVFRRRIAATEDPGPRVALMRQFADLLALRMHDLGAAISTLRRLLEIEPGDQAALIKLDRWLAEQGRGSERREVLERLVEASEDPSVRQEARLRWAELEAHELQDPTRALELAAANLAEAPGHQRTRAWLEGRVERAIETRDRSALLGLARTLQPAYRATEDWNALIALARRRVELTVEAAGRADLLAEIAAHYGDGLDQPDLSFATLVEAIRLAPGRSDLRARAESLAEDNDLVEELVDAYLEIAPTTADPDASVALLRFAGRALDRGEVDPDRAEATWADVARRLPDDPEAVRALEHHARRRDDPTALVTVLERRAAVANEDRERFALAAELGRLYAERFGDRDRAKAHLRSAHGLAPADRGVALALARVLDANEDAAELFDVFAALEKGASKPSDKVPVLLRMAHLAENALQRRDSALREYSRVLELDPANRHAFQGLERIYESAGRWSDLVRLLETRLERSSDPDERVGLQRRLGSIRAARLGSPDEAIAAWQQVLAQTPNDEEALTALRGLYRQQEQWEGLAGVLRRLLTLVNDVDEVKAVRFELAEVLLEHLQAPTDAVEVARRIIDIEPHTASELFRLEELLVKAGAYGEAVRAKTRRAELCDELVEKIEVLEEVAELYESRIRRTAGAIQTFEQILRMDPRHEGALDGLARLYEAHGDYRSLVNLMGHRVQQAVDEQERGRLHLRVADLQERALGSKDLAFAAACAAFTEGGASPEAQALMQRLAAETDNEDMLVDVLEDQVDAVDFERGLGLRLEVAKLAASNTDEPERAERHLEMLLAMQPGHPEASQLLDQIFREQGRWEDLVMHLRDQSELITDLEKVREVLEQVARLEETQLNRRDAAIQTWGRILDRFPEDRGVTAELERLYRDDGRSEALLDLLERRASAGEPEPRIDALLQIARIREHDLGQIDHAIESLRAVLELDPAHTEALDALERLYVSDERWAELLQIYERQLGIAQTPDEAAAILTKMAVVHEERLGQPEQAAATYERVFDASPGHLPTARALSRLLRTSGSVERRAELLEMIRGTTPDAGERIASTLELARAYAGPLGRPEAADALFREILAAEPTSLDALGGMVGLAEAKGDWSRAVDLLRRQADVAPAERTTAIYHRIGDIGRHRLADVALARGAYERALDVDPQHVPSLTALREMAETEGDPGRLRELLEREAGAERDASRAADLYHRAAVETLEAFDDVDRALALLRRALQAVPTHRRSLTEVSELLFSDEQYEEAVPHLEALIGVLNPERDRAELGKHHYRRAYVAERIGDAESALRHYLASYEADASYLPTLEGLGAALVAAKRYEDAQRIYQTILVQHRDALTDAEVVDLYHEVGDLALELGQVDRAKKSLVKALEIDARHVATLGSLADLSERQGEYEEAYDFRERMLEQLTDPEARFAAFVRQGELCQHQIREPYRAIDAFNSALAIRPDALDVQHALVPLLEATRQFPAAIQRLIQIAEATDDSEAERDLWIKAGDLQWEKERAWMEASESYNRALDLDPMHAPALQRIEAMLAEAKQWKALEENYIRMIRRLPKDNRKARVTLWKTLGELYSRVLKDPAGAARAYEVVFSLEPNDPDIGLTLAQIYRKQPAKRAEATQICQRIIPVVPDPTPATRLFAELAYEQGQYDLAFCGLGALMLVRAAQEEEVRAYRALLEKAPAWPTGSLSDSQWKRVLMHPACRGPLGDLVGAIYRHAPDLFSTRRRELALKKKERVDLSDKGRNAPVRLRYFDVWGRVAAVLGGRDVEHYRRPGSVDPPLLLPGAPRAALYVGEQHEVFKTMPVRQVAWLVGRQMAAARPELAPVRALSPADFVAMVEGAAQMFETTAGFAQQLDPRVVQAWAKALRSQISDPAGAELGRLIVPVAQQGSLREYQAYLEGAEHTASRAALLVSGDWITASRGLGEGDALTDLPRESRVRELVAFSTSAELAALREALSASVQV